MDCKPALRTEKVMLGSLFWRWPGLNELAVPYFGNALLPEQIRRWRARGYRLKIWSGGQILDPRGL
jgi:hypothetical protein